MATAVVYIAASVDGYIARPDGALDWLPSPSGDDYGYADFIAGIDALVMGRHTFDVVRGFGGEWPYTDPVVVLTSRPLDVPEALAGRVTVRAGEPAEILRGLAAEGARRVWVDGGETIQRFLRAGLVEELILTRIPILLGSGIRLFGALEADVHLVHEETRTWPDGLVQSRYRVGETPGAPRGGAIS